MKIASLLAALTALFFAASAFARSERFSYPSEFLWGAAFSAHQTEGLAGGGENSDWYDFEHPHILPSPIKNDDTADVADDFWHRYEEDLQNAKALGLNSLRTSIAWEKVEPKRGEFNANVVSHYRDIFSRMKALGLRPMICLDHFTSPKWFDDEGGWTNDQAPREFLEYAKVIVSSLGDVTHLWITFNEPMILVEEGYLKGETPPRKIGLTNAFKAAYNLARAHRMVATYIHQVQPLTLRQILDIPGGPVNGVGIAYAFSYFEPADPKNQNDVQATDNLMNLSDWDWLKGVETGHLEFRLHVFGQTDKVWAKDLPASDLPVAPGPENPMFDWIGVNYYQRYLIKYKNALIPFDWITPPGPQGDNGWAIYPQGLENILRDVAQRFKEPLVVTENGIADGADSRRPQFIRDHLHFLDNAVLGNGKPGSALDVRGYYHWSLMDNFEWLSGYMYKFGLFEVQFKNGLKRVARPSASVYQEEIHKRQRPLWGLFRDVESE